MSHGETQAMQGLRGRSGGQVLTQVMEKGFCGRRMLGTVSLQAPETTTITTVLRASQPSQ